MTRRNKPAPPPKTELTAKLDKLAAQIADELSTGGAPMDEKIGGLRALTAYYAMIHRLPPPPDEDKGQFGGFAARLKEHAGTPKKQGANDF